MTFNALGVVNTIGKRGGELTLSFAVVALFALIFILARSQPIRGGAQ